MTSTMPFLRRIRKRLGSWLSDAAEEGVGRRDGSAGGAGSQHALFEVLFPGEGGYSREKAGMLADRLRREAERLVGGGDVGERGDAPATTEKTTAATVTTSKKTKQKQAFDFSRYQKRFIALDIAYRGFDYHGFARSDDVEKTIEEELFGAMRRTKLVPEGVGWRELGYSRGGRTDKGVSAAGQVVALEVRSKGLVGEGVVGEGGEYDYCQMLNSVMSENVRVLGWQTVGEEFSARFSCDKRRYKFWFVRREGELDVGRMREGAGYLVGTHDFRNLCKADVPTVTNFVRRIVEATVDRVDGAGATGYEVFELNIVGTAFLWHQIRCIAAVLAMVGEGMEASGVVGELLDVERVACKPQFKMAEPEPLLLYECSYNELEGRWIRPPGVLNTFKREVDKEVRMLLTKAQVLLATRDRVIFDENDGNSGSGGYDDNVRNNNKRGNRPRHIPLLERKREPSIEERLARHGLTVVSKPPREREGQ